MKVLISGGSGFIGSALTTDLVRDGHEVIILTRQVNALQSISPRVRFAHWDARTLGDWAAELEQVDAVVNLIGENIGAKRWSPAQKAEILASRVNPGNALTQAIRSASHKPGVFVQISGIGAYGMSEDKVFTESDDYGDDFGADVTRAWEASTSPVEAMGVRRVIARTGVVLHDKKGALPRMLLPFKFFVGGRLGSGRQWFSWIHLADAVRGIKFLIDTPQAKGIYNLCAESVTNRVFAREVGKALRRPALIPVPAFILKTMFGEMSTIILEGQNVTAKRLQELGFEFLYPKLDAALQNLHYH
jgi:uncharacterized protein (TIGR01777 family)